MPVIRLNNYKSTPHAKSFGTLADLHPAFEKITRKADALKTINSLLSRAAHHIAEPKPSVLTRHHTHHSVAGPMLYSGPNLDNFGRWYQICSKSDGIEPGCQYPRRFISQAVPHELIWDNAELVRLLFIREELFPKPRGKPSPTKAKEISLHEKNLLRLNPYLARLVNTPLETETTTAPQAEPSLRPVCRRLSFGQGQSSQGAMPGPSLRPESSNDESVKEASEDRASNPFIVKPFPMLEPEGSMYKPSAHVYFWGQSTNNRCHQMTLLPDSTGFVYLNKQKLILGQTGIELIGEMDRFMFEQDAWVSFPLEIAIGPIDIPGYPILIREAGLEDLHHMEQIISLTRAELNRIRKGKGRAV